jgi:hypothetical protein
VDVLVISGSMGAGKTTVLGEASDLLTIADVPHGAIDLDALAAGHIPVGWADDLVFRNLRAVSDNYRALGIARLLIAAAVDSRQMVDRLRDATAADSLVVCRLCASLDTMQGRVRAREPGMWQAQFVARVVELERQLDACAVEDFTLRNEDGGVTEVARQMLRRAGWA